MRYVSKLNIAPLERHCRSSPIWDVFCNVIVVTLWEIGQMNKSTVILILAIAAATSSCGERDETQPLFGSPAAAPPVDGTSAETQPTNTGDSSAAVDTPDTASQTPSTGLPGAQNTNPGDVPNPVLAEVTSLDTSGLSSMRGHKVFAGYEILIPAEGLNRTLEFRFFNIDFPCQGIGFWEGFPSGTASQPTTGSLVWQPTFADNAVDLWEIDVSQFITGTHRHFELNPIQAYPVTYGNVIVGTTAIEQLVVSRIVQYEECS